MAIVETVGIVSKPGVAVGSKLVPELIGWLHSRGIHVRYDIETGVYAGSNDGMDRDHVPDGTQLIIVLGGDGTLLSAARAVGGREIPLFAVNLGGLGFLTAITNDELFPELERALKGEQRIAKRKMLACKVLREDEHVSRYDALNDIVLTKVSLARMIDLEIYVDKHFVSRYRADGLIITTPTGSTAYSLSAGGPIIFPQVGALAITPICPHMLTNRPVIVPDTSEIIVIPHGEEESIQLTVDGQVGEIVQSGDRIACFSSDKSVHLVRPPRMLFFDVLRAKLKWGER